MSEPNIYYHICMIDISQKWDLKKRGENWWKKLMGQKDTSAQQPSFYQARFMSFVEQIISEGPEEAIEVEE